MLAVVILVLQVEKGPIDLSGHTAARIGDAAYLAGGWTGIDRDPSPIVWCYSIPAKTWRKVAPMSIPRGFGSSVVWNGKMLVLGGIGKDGGQSSRIDAYDPKTNTWTHLGELPNPMSRFASLAWNGHLYLSGGFNGSSDRFAHNSAGHWRWNPDKTWTALATMPVPRHAHCLAGFQGRIWAIGGHGNDHKKEGIVESYDPITNSWRTEQPLPGSRGFFGVEVIDGKLVAFGSVKGEINPVEWTPAGWRPRQSSDLHNRRFAYVRDGNQILIFGGEAGGPFVKIYKPS